LGSELAQYRLDADQDRIIIGFSSTELLRDSDPWLLRKRFSNTLFARDLFDMKQALVADTYFFGRQGFVLDLLDRFKRGENIGLYGLRKTGKTSALFKLRRVIASEKAGAVVYVDAQDPAVYSLRWWELLSQIKDTAATNARVTLPHPLNRPFTEQTALTRTRQAFDEIISKLRGAAPRLLIIIDEVEHLYPNLALSDHWKQDFLPLWKLLRAIQTQERRMSILIAGVNSQVSEQPTVLDQDNPLFSLVGTRYIPSFSSQETREMVQTLGRRMGIIFEGKACDYLTGRYGGHPLLVRLACSWEHHSRLDQELLERPITITEDALRLSEAEREQELLYYARHILDVLRLWYPEEYQILSLLAAEDHKEFEAYALELPESIKHLRAYGLLEKAGTTLSIGLLTKFLKIESRRLARRNPPPQTPSTDPPRTFAKRPVEEVMSAGESTATEFKSTLRMNLASMRPDSRLEHACLKTIAAFLNSGGGDLLIGVNDKGVAVGCLSEAFDSEDRMTTHLVNLIRDKMGPEHSGSISSDFVDVDAKRILRVHCSPSPRPVFVKSDNDELFYVRLLAATEPLSVRQAQTYIATRWHSGA
jgi:Cdc6-like AAA superfamily ATPase